MWKSLKELREMPRTALEDHRDLIMRCLHNAEDDAADIRYQLAERGRDDRRWWRSASKALDRKKKRARRCQLELTRIHEVIDARERQEQVRVGVFGCAGCPLLDWEASTCTAADREVEHVEPERVQHWCPLKARPVLALVTIEE